MAQPKFYVTQAGVPLWVATMPYGTTDRAFAELIAASIPGSEVVTGK